MRQSSITSRLLVLTAAFILVNAAFVTFYILLLDRVSTSSISTTKKLVSDYSGLYQQLESLAGLQNDVQRLLREKDIDKLEAMVKEFQTNQTQLAQQIAARGEAGKALTPLFAQWSQISSKTIEQFLQGNVADANNLLITELTPQFATILGTLREQRLTTEKSSETQVLAATRSMTQTRNWTLGVSLAILAGLLTFSWILRRNIVRRLTTIFATLNESCQVLAQISGQVNESSQAVADGANTQAASLEETSASLEEITSMTQSNAQNADQAKTIADTAQTAAHAGQKQAANLTTTMDAINGASKKIESILRTIDGIAFQTNLLALNAAVEAARAGEAGKGFAVVAQEVRNLAQRSADAAKQTADIIQESLHSTKQGAEVSHSVASNLSELNTRSTELNEVVSQIASAIKEQAAGVGQINTALAEIGKVTQTNSTKAAESTQAVEQLQGQLVKVQSCLGDLSLLIDGTRK